MKLIRAQGSVGTPGTSGSTTIQVENLTKYSGSPTLSTPITISSGCYLGSIGIISSPYSGVSTDDEIKIYVTGTSASKALGLQVSLEYQLSIT
jgi:hypothetical protein